MPAAADVSESREPASTKNLVALYESGNFVEAEALAKELIGLHPREHMAWKVLGAIQLKNNQFDKSLESSHRCVELSRDDAAVYNNIAMHDLALTT
jgi:Flp pilus assembly protein TadD